MCGIREVYWNDSSKRQRLLDNALSYLFKMDERLPATMFERSRSIGKVQVGGRGYSGYLGSSILLTSDLEPRMTIEQLAKSTRSVFELHYESLTGLPFFISFPLNCCQGASVVFGMLVSLQPTQHTVTVVKGNTRDRRESHYWLEIDGLNYDLTLDQFQETLGNRFDGIDAPLYGAEKHPLRMHFFYKERYSAVLAFSIFCQKHANLEGVDAALQFVNRKLATHEQQPS